MNKSDIIAKAVRKNMKKKKRSELLPQWGEMEIFPNTYDIDIMKSQNKFTTYISAKIQAEIYEGIEAIAKKNSIEQTHSVINAVLEKFLRQVEKNHQ